MTGCGEHVRRRQCCPGNGFMRQGLEPTPIGPPATKWPPSITAANMGVQWGLKTRRKGPEQPKKRPPMPLCSHSLPSLSLESPQETQASYSHASILITPLYTVKPALNQAGSHCSGRSVGLCEPNTEAIQVTEHLCPAPVNRQ